MKAIEVGSLRTSLILSLVLHGVVLSMALTSFSAHESADNAAPVSVDIVAASEVSSVKAGRPDGAAGKTGAVAESAETPSETRDTAGESGPVVTASKKEAALPPPKPKTRSRREEKAASGAQDSQITEKKAQAAVPPPVRRAAPPERRQALTQRDENRPPPEQARPERSDRIAELIRKPAPRTQETSDFDARKISALLNRDPEASRQPQAGNRKQPGRKPSSFQAQAAGLEREPPRPRIAARGAPDGRDQRMTANEIDAFRAQISRCWTPPVGGLGGDAIIVRLRIRLNENGTLARPPRVANRGNSPFFRPAADSAVRAVAQCQPYRMPPEKYAKWRDMLLTFDPRRMYGG